MTSMLNKAKTLKGYKLHSFEDEIGKAREYYYDELNRFTSLYLIKPEIGKVKEFYFDDYYWAIRYLIIDTKNWWPGKKVLVSPQWIERINWNESKVFINLLRETIKQSPEYTEDTLLTREYEIELYQYYNRQGYWVEEPVPKKHSL